MSWHGNPVPGFTRAQRAAILIRDRLCQCSGCPACGGRCTRGSVEADHVLNRAQCAARGIDPNTLDNGQGLCRECHTRKTQAESTAAKRATRAKLRHPGAR